MFILHMKGDKNTQSNFQLSLPAVFIPVFTSGLLDLDSRIRLAFHGATAFH